jgi:hypothetical protein
MKTAMQEMIQWIVDNQFPVNKEFVEKTIELTMKEKEQIADAFRNGSTSSMLGGGHWTQYYNQTYNL